MNINDTKNFEKYFELIQDNDNIIDEYKKQLVELILSIEEIACNFKEDDSIDVKKKHSAYASNQIRTINKILIDTIFDFSLDSNSIRGIMEEWEEQKTSHDKIMFLNNKGYVNKDIKNALHGIKNLSNRGNHVIFNKDLLTKIEIVFSLDYISIILHKVFDLRTNRKFKSESYYLDGTENNNIDERIKKNINDRTFKTIKINDEKIINILFDKKISFHIPLYQRGYAWESNEINDLFNDIEKRIEDDNDHFFGNVTFIKVNNTHKIKVVDGQQRLTTMTLMLKAIYNRYLEIYNNSKVNDEPFRTFIHRVDPPLVRVDDKKSTKIFDSIWRNNENTNITKDELEKNNIYIAFKLISNKFKKMDLETLDTYYKTLKRFVVGINWTTNYNEFELFESLNSKGKVLSDFDIFKNYLFSIIDPAVEKNNEKQLLRIFEDYIVFKLNIPSAKKREAITKSFLEKAIESYGEKPKSGKKLFTHFKYSFEEKRKSNNEKIKNLNLKEYEELVFYFSKLLTAVMLTQVEDASIWKEFNLFDFFNDYTLLSNSKSYTSVLIPYIMDENNFVYDKYDGTLREVKDPKSFRKILKLIEIWKVKRDVAHNEGNETIGSYIASFNSKIRKNMNSNKDFYVLLKGLIESEEGFLRLPSTEAFVEKLSKDLLSNTSVIKLIYYRIEQKFSDEPIGELGDWNYYPIIPKESKKRNTKFNSLFDKLNIKNIDSFDMIGNYFIYKKTPKLKDINKGDMDINDYVSLLVDDNFSINIRNKDSNFNSIKDVPELVRKQGDYEKLIKEKSEKIALIAKEIFDENKI